MSSADKIGQFRIKLPSKFVSDLVDGEDILQDTFDAICADDAETRVQAVIDSKRYALSGDYEHAGHKGNYTDDLGAAIDAFLNGHVDPYLKLRPYAGYYHFTEPQELTDKVLYINATNGHMSIDDVHCPVTIKDNGHVQWTYNKITYDVQFDLGYTANDLAQKGHMFQGNSTDGKQKVTAYIKVPQPDNDLPDPKQGDNGPNVLAIVLSVLGAGSGLAAIGVFAYLRQNELGDAWKKLKEDFKAARDNCQNRIKRAKDKGLDRPVDINPKQKIIEDKVGDIYHDYVKDHFGDVKPGDLTRDQLNEIQDEVSNKISPVLKDAIGVESRLEGTDLLGGALDGAADPDSEDMDVYRPLLDGSIVDLSSKTFTKRQIALPAYLDTLVCMNQQKDIKKWVEDNKSTLEGNYSAAAAEIIRQNGIISQANEGIKELNDAHEHGEKWTDDELHDLHVLEGEVADAQAEIVKQEKIEKDNDVDAINKDADEKIDKYEGDIKKHAKDIYGEDK
ncbi:hypothetical protein ABW19_dt0206376 [Dactylella cylindrospora]|nr:hypothetical protein ABW19_dt0206376 [Dactylella cylindrospora]